MSNQIFSHFDDEEIQMLLPFYVTGRLDRSEADQIDDHVSRRSDLAELLSLVQDERTAAIEANKAIAAPARNFQRVAAAIATPPARPAGPDGRPWDQIKRWFEMPLPQARGWAAAAALLLIVLQGAAIASLVAVRNSQNFVAASGSQETAGRDSVVLVRFADGATTAAVADMLTGLGMSIVDGPRGGGVFTVRLGAKDMNEAERDRAIADLRTRSDAVTFVARLP